jgi:hypothetical protein
MSTVRRTRFAGALAFHLCCALATVASMPMLVAESAHAQGGPIAINIAPLILVEPGTETPLPIQLAANGELPKSSFIRIRGLPAAARLSEGHLVAAGSWAVPLSALPSLKVWAPLSPGAKSQLTVALVGVDGIVWAETTATFAVVAASAIGLNGAPASPSATVAAVNPAPSDAGPALSGPVPRPNPARGTRPPLSPEDQQRAESLMLKGKAQLRDGDVAGARLFFQRAADIGSAQAALALAETYDPHELPRLRVQGMQPDPAAARQWYERALQLGAPEASHRLQRLGSN